MNQKLIDMAVSHQQGSKLISSGRVVVLRDSVSLPKNPIESKKLTAFKHFYPSNIGILLKAAPPQKLESGLIQKVKGYFVLALVHPDIKTGHHGKSGLLLV